MCFLVINSRPELKDLNNLVTPEYGVHWKVIGTQLGIEKGILDSIEASYPTNVLWCCNKFLETWHETDTDASWKKIIEAINCPAVAALRTVNTTSLQVISGNHLSTCICICNYQYRHHIVSSFKL